MNTSAPPIVVPLSVGEAVNLSMPTAQRVVDAVELLGGSRVVVIDYRGTLYRLSLTHNDRLVLQK